MNDFGADMQQRQMTKWTIRKRKHASISIYRTRCRRKAAKRRARRNSARQIRQQLRDKALIPVSVDPVEQKDKHSSKHGFKNKLPPMIWLY